MCVSEISILKILARIKITFSMQAIQGHTVAQNLRGTGLGIERMSLYHHWLENSKVTALLNVPSQIEGGHICLLEQRNRIIE